MKKKNTVGEAVWAETQCPSFEIKISCVLSRRSGPSNQACVGPDRPTSSSLVSLYPALGYRAIMQEMSPTAFGEQLKSRLPVRLP